MPILDRRKDRFVEDQDKRVSVGIDFPFGRVGNGDGYFKSTKTTIDAIKNNIKLLLQTNQGERLFQPNLGMNLKNYLFQQMTEETSIQIENDIVDVFRPSNEVHAIAKDTIKIGAKVLWLQLGIKNDEAKQLVESKNIQYVENKCTKMEYQTLFLKVRQAFPALQE